MTSLDVTQYSLLANLLISSGVDIISKLSYIPEGCFGILHPSQDSVLKGNSYTVPGHIKSIKSWAFLKSPITSIDLGSVEKIKSGAFGFSSITSVTIPKSCNYIGAGSFYECKDLKSLKIKGDITDIEEEAFRGCKSLNNVTLNEGLQSIWTGAFMGCESLKEIRFPSTLKYIGPNAFEGCTNLKKVYFDGDIDNLEVEDFIINFWKEFKILG